MFESERWRVGHCVGPLGVGTLLIKPKRHVTRVSDLDSRQAAEQGPLLQRAAKVIDALMAPEQTYPAVAWRRRAGAHPPFSFNLSPERYGTSTTSPDRASKPTYSQQARRPIHRRSERSRRRRDRPSGCTVAMRQAPAGKPCLLSNGAVVVLVIKCPALEI